MQGSQHLDRADGGAGEFGRDILGDAGQAEHADVQGLPGSSSGFEIGQA